MSDAATAGAPASPTPRRRRRLVTLLAAGSLVVAGIILAAVPSRVIPKVRPPWTVWAPRTGPATAPVFGPASATVGGPSLEGAWCAAMSTSASVSTGVVWVAPNGSWDDLRLAVGLPVRLESSSYWISGDERTDAAGTTWVRLFAEPDSTGLETGATDGPCAGTWDLRSAHGAKRRVELVRGGRVEGTLEGSWTVRDGVLMVEALESEDDDRDLVGDSWCFTAILAADGASFVEGRNDTGTRIRGTKAAK